MRVTVAGSVVVLAVLVLFLFRPAPIGDLDARACDLLGQLAGPGHPSAQVAIVEIDDKSLERVGRWPWPRSTVGKLSEEILEAGASTVALDMMFAQDDRADDAALAQEVAGKPVVAGYALKFDGENTGSTDCRLPPLPLAFVTSGDSGAPPFFQATGVVCNVPPVAASIAGSGFLNAAPDHDGILRHVPVIAEYGNRQYPSLALEAVEVFRHVATTELDVSRGGAWRLHLDHLDDPLEPKSVLRLRFRGSRHQFPCISAGDILSGHAPQDLLRNKIAVVGGSAAGMESPVVTPADSLLPAVELQATAIDNLLRGDSFYRPEQGRLWELALAALAGWLAAVLLRRSGFLWGALATLVLIVAVWAFCSLLLAASGALYSPLPATIGLACSLPVITLVHYFHEKERADLAQQQLLQTLRHSRQILEESEHRYRRLVENVNDAIIMDDVDGKLVFANRRFREWFGLKEGDDANLVLENYVAPEWRAEIRERHNRRMRGEPAADHFEFEGIRSDGTRIWIEALVTTLEENGKITGSQAALRDTTERKRMEAQYLQSQKMESVGRLAGGVAHDFNNLLTVINGYSGMLLGQFDPGDRRHRYAEEIQRAGERAADLTQNLLTFSRKQKVNVRPLDLNALVAEAKKMFERVIGEDIHLTTRLSTDLGLVVADPGQLHQVLMNLVVNARDAMPNGGAVTIETKTVIEGPNTKHFAYLGVSDTGTGLGDDVKQHLFEPFFTTKDQGKGTGLGLATVYGIVQQCGGRIEVTSVLGKGTTFQIYLPCTASSSADLAKPVQITPAVGGRETLLLVEDQDAVREFTATMLETFGYRVLRASNGPEAITTAEKHPGAIDLLVTDIILPVMDGRVLAEKLRGIHPEAKVLYISGYSDERIGRGGAFDSDFELLQKPFTPEALGERVRKILNEDQQRRAKSK